MKSRRGGRKPASHTHAWFDLITARVAPEWVEHRWAGTALINSAFGVALVFISTPIYFFYRGKKKNG